MKKLFPLLLFFVVTPAFAITCAQVTCDEARSYPQMDRDNDGYYCEAQCGNYTPVKKVSTKATNPTSIKVTPVKKVAVKTTVKSKYILGPRGGCYYLNKKAKKVYVDKKYCR